MALKPAGVELIAKNYTAYLNQQKQIKKAHQEAFNTQPLNKWTATASKMNSSFAAVTKSANKTDEAIGNLKNTISKTSDTASNSSNRFSGLGDKIGGLKNKFTSAKGGVAGFGKSLLRGAGGANTMLASLSPLIKKIPLLGTALAALNMKQYIDQSTALAVRNETLAVTYDVVAKNAGYSAEQANFAKQALKDTGITSAGATKQLQKMAQAGLDWGNAAKLARVAQDAAVIAGYDSTAAFESMTWAIQTGSAEILDNFGIMVRFSKVYEEYAQSLGKSAGALSEQEKLQARMNAVLKEGEKISGTYTAALGTAGKMQGSMVRVTEELSVNVGEVFLPFETLSTEIKMNFVKGLLEASKGLKVFSAVTKTMVEVWKSSGKALSETWRSLFGGVNKDTKESMSIFERFGRGFQAWARIIVESTAIAKLAIQGFRKEVQDNIVNLAVGFGKLFKGDFAGAGEAFGRLKDSIFSAGSVIKATIKENLGSELDKIREKFPDLYTDWDKLGEVAEVAMDKVTKSVDDAIAALETQKKQLEAQSAVVKKASKIYEDFQKGIKEANDDLARNAAKLEADFDKSMVNAAEKRNKALAKLEDQSGKQRQKLIDNNNKQRLKREKKANDAIAKAREKFQLGQLQSLRRFKLKDRRLQASGDVLALKDLREDFALRKQEEKENFDLSQKDKKKSASDQNRDDEKALKDRLNELKTNIDERRAEIINANKEETDNLTKDLITNRAKLKDDYAKQIRMLVASKDEQLVELGKSMRDNALITKEGMENVGNIMAETFGDEGVAINLLKGWTSTSRTQTEQAMMQIKDQFVDLDKAITDMQDKRKSIIEQNKAGTLGTPSAAASDGSSTSVSAGLPPPMNKFGTPMRHGGSGVVEGPASFNVEPGVKEAFMFAPVNRFSGDVNVKGRAGLDVTGMGSNVSPDIEQKIADKMIEEITIAIQRMSRRGS